MERFNKINNIILKMDDGAFYSICSSYEQSFKYGTRNIFENICKAFGMNAEDFVFWYEYRKE